MTLRSILEKEFFPYVVRPARYQGNEWGAKDYDVSKTGPPRHRVALIVPDKYERGMCLPELQLCYNFFRADPRVQCERAFAPDLDAEQLLREKGMPLFSLESRTPLKEFDELVFLISDEMSAASILNVLELSQIPFKVEQRSGHFPKVCGVPVRPVNLSVLSGVFDSNPELMDQLDLESLRRDHQFSFPPIISFEDLLHDRLIVTLPREYEPAGFATRIAEQIALSGYEEFSISGDVLNFGDNFKQLCSSLIVRLTPESSVRCLLPPLPPNLLTLDQFDRLAFGRRRSLRFLMGAGSEYLREGLGLFFDMNRFLELAATAYARHWRSMRLFFYLGIPEESEADLQEIVEIIHAVEDLGFQYGEKHSVQVTLEPLVPRPFTKWQWDEILPAEEYVRRVEWIKQRVKKQNIQLRAPAIEIAVVSALLARGGEAAAPVVRSAYAAGARFDSWQEHFSCDLWRQAFSENGLEIKQLSRRIALDTSIVSEELASILGVSDAGLREQRKNAFPDHRRKSSSAGFTIGDIILARPDVAEQILTPTDEEKRSFGRKPKRTTQASTVAVPRSRIRFQWRKGDQVRHLGHLACMKMFERAIRRARIPVEYTQGQQPRQKVSLGPPLTLGYTSDAEYFDLHLERPYQEEFLCDLNQELPPGFDVVRARPVFGKVSSVAAQINLACYEAELDPAGDLTEESLQDVLKEDSLPIVRKRGDEEKLVDIRPAIFDLQLVVVDSHCNRLEMVLGLGNLGFVRPDEVLTQCLNFDDKEVLALKIHRRALLVVQGERRMSPFEVS